MHAMAKGPFPVFACAGKFFPVGTLVEVPAGFEAEAANNPLLEVVTVDTPGPPPAEQTDTPEPEHPPGPDLGGMTLAELRALAEQRGLSTTGLRKAEIVRKLEGEA